jgi:hypothetical protein
MDHADRDEATINATLGVLLKYPHDVQQYVQGALACVLAQRAHSMH